MFIVSLVGFWRSGSGRWSEDFIMKTFPITKCRRGNRLRSLGIGILRNVGVLGVEMLSRVLEVGSSVFRGRVKVFGINSESH